MGDGSPLARWLDAEAVAQHVSIRTDYVARYVKAGKLPKPKHPWGPRQPRWDREELDAFMAGGTGSSSLTSAVQAYVENLKRSSRPARRS